MGNCMMNLLDRYSFCLKGKPMHNERLRLHVRSTWYHQRIQFLRRFSHQQHIIINFKFHFANVVSQCTSDQYNALGIPADCVQLFNYYPIQNRALWLELVMSGMEENDGGGKNSARGYGWYISRCRTVMKLVLWVKGKRYILLFLLKQNTQ